MNVPRRVSTPPGGGQSHLAYLSLGVILFIYLALASLHSLIVPITQGEDELAHYRYLSFIAETGRLPATRAERQQAWYRSDWPPLYHLLVGWTVSSLDTTRPHLKDVGESPRRRLVGEIFYPRLIIYTEDANWPWQDGILAWHIGRFMSIAFGAAALIFVYVTTLEISRGAEERGSRGETASPHPRSRAKPPFGAAPSHLIAAAVTAMLAFSPRFLFTSAMLSDDSLFILLSAVFIWLLLRAWRGDDRPWVYAGMGLALGLSIATKYSTGLLPLLVIPLVVRRARQAGWSRRQAAGRVALTWLAVVVGAGWWFGWIGYHFNTVRQDGLIFGLLRPFLAAGPDVSMRRVFAFLNGSQFTGPERPAAVAAGSLWDWLVYFFQTFWGVPVLEQDPLFPWAYLVLLGLCLLALVGLILSWPQAPAGTQGALALLALVVGLLLPFPVLRYFLTHNVLETGQGRHLLFPAAQAIPILLVYGWAAIDLRRFIALRSSAKPPFGTLYALPPLLLLAWSIFQLFYMAQTYPAPLPVRTTTFNPAALPVPLQHDFGPDIHFLGYNFEPDPELPTVYLTLFWQARQPVDENYRTAVQLVGTAGRPALTWLSHPLDGVYPTRAWDAGDVVRDRLALPLAGLSPDTYRVQVSLLHEADDQPVAGTEPFVLLQFAVPVPVPVPGGVTLTPAAGQAGPGVVYHLAASRTPARPRQALALSWSSPETGLGWTLIGPDGIPRRPAATSPATVIFLVGTEWPSGPYALQAEAGPASYRTGPVVTVVNEARLFELPVMPDGWTPVEATFALPQGQAQVELLGYSLPDRRVAPGGSVPISLYWQSLAPVLADSLTFAVLLDANQQPYGQVDRYPAGFYSPLLWAPGEIVGDSFNLPVQPDAPAGIYWLHLGQYRRVARQPESLVLLQDGQPTETTAVVAGPLKVGGPPPGVVSSHPAPQTSLDVTFGQQITLLGYDTDLAGETLRLRLYWRAEAAPAADYTTFLHLLDKANDTVAQQDGPPAGGRYPTSLWDAGEVIVDEVVVPLDGVAPGQYTPVVGLYELSSGIRLGVPGRPANELPLAPLTLKGS